MPIWQRLDPIANPRFKSGRELLRVTVGGSRRTNISEYSPRFDRRELELIAEKNHAGVFRNSRKQACHQRKINHRGFVDEQRVHRQRVFGIVPESRNRATANTETSVDRDRRGWNGSLHSRITWQTLNDLLHRTGKRRGGFPSWSHHGDADRNFGIPLLALSLRESLLDNQSQDLARGRSLPGTWTAGDHRQLLRNRDRSGQSLSVERDGI